MSGSKHTPGTWSVETDTYFHGVVWAEEGGRRHMVCGLTRCRSSDESKANARLVSAAPDLLAALKQMRRTTCGDESEESVVADAAIAKAEGED